MQSPTEVLRTILAADYQLEAENVGLLAEGGKWVYRVRCEEVDWVVRLLRADADSYHTNSLKNAHVVLTHLEKQQYPAEQLVRTRDGRALLEVDGWLVLATRFMGASLKKWQGASGEGVAAPSRLSSEECAADDLRAIGETLGKLHSVPLDDALPVALTLPRRDLVSVERMLGEMGADVPKALGGEYERLVEHVRQTDLCEGLPQVLLHQDCHPSNIVHAPDGQIVFVDWDGSGVGPAVLDLGQLLGTCFSVDFAVDAEAIAAVVEGYGRQRRLDAEERARLPDAMAFRLLVLLGAFFPQRASGDLADGDLVYGMTYAQWQAKYGLVEEMAATAQRCFDSLD